MIELIDYTNRGSRPAQRMLQSIERRIRILRLDLSGLRVVTEAATGAYASTAVIAAMSGASVHACSRDTLNYGRAGEAIGETQDLARLAGVEDRITFSLGVPPGALAECDILTNSGRIRPISRTMIELLPPDAVIALMFEAWEFRYTDLDRDACRDRGIRIVGVNERHRDVAVFPFLGPLCVRLLRDAGMNAAGKRVAVICDNPFATFLRDGLVDAGAEATLFQAPAELTRDRWDAVVLSMLPRELPLDRDQLQIIADRAPGAVLARFWGDIDRDGAQALGLRVHPSIDHARGHMGILLSRLGHEPVVRLQAGGLKAAEIIRRDGPLPPGGLAELL